MSTLEKHVEEALLEAERWVNQANEKVAWCSDLSGDKYSVLAKQTTAREFAGSISVGDEKIQAALKKVELLDGVASESKKKELEGRQQILLRQWKNFNDSVEETR